MIDIVLDSTEFHCLKGITPAAKSILFVNTSTENSIFIHPITFSPMFEAKLAEETSYSSALPGFTILDSQTREIHVRPSSTTEYGIFEFEINFDYEEGAFVLDENDEAILDEDGYPILI